jgi:hypothetical protein
MVHSRGFVKRSLPTVVQRFRAAPLGLRAFVVFCVLVGAADIVLRLDGIALYRFTGAVPAVVYLFGAIVGLRHLHEPRTRSWWALLFILGLLATVGPAWTILVPLLWMGALLSSAVRGHSLRQPR